MIIWIVKLEEPIFFSKNFRFYRAHILAHFLMKNKHSITFFSSNSTRHRHNNNEKKFLKKKKFSYIFLPSYFYNYYKFSYFFKLFSEFYQSYKLYIAIKKIKEKPDVIVTFIPSITISKIITKYAIANKIKLIVDCRDLHPDIFQKELPYWMRLVSATLNFKLKNDLSFICNHADSFTGINEFFVNHLKKYRKKKNKILSKVFEISYKPNLNLKLNQIKKIKLEKSEFKIIFFGTINKTFFSAYKKFFKNYFYSSNIFFYFAGNGRCISQLLEDIKNKKNLIYLGDISQSFMIKNYSQFDAFIYLMDNRLDYLNSLSNKFFEAIFFNLPIITFNRGLSRKVLELYKLGFYCKSYKILLSNLIRLKIRNYKNNKIKFLKKYSCEKIYSNYSKYIERI